MIDLSELQSASPSVTLRVVIKQEVETRVVWREPLEDTYRAMYGLELDDNRGDKSP
jgi:hypothetical protein